jgi:hypothetical protein
MAFTLYGCKRIILNQQTQLGKPGSTKLTGLLLSKNITISFSKLVAFPIIILTFA